jgi:cytochrome c553
MMRKLSFVPLPIDLAVIASHSGNSRRQLHGSRGAGFMTYCAACHGVSGVGDGTVAEF